MWWPTVAAAGLGPISTVILAAQNSGGGGGFDPTSLIGTVVTPSVVIILVIMGKLRTEAEVKRLELRVNRQDEALKAKDDQLASLQSGLLERAIPALTKTTLVLEQLAPALDEIIDLHHEQRRTTRRHHTWEEDDA